MTEPEYVRASYGPAPDQSRVPPQNVELEMAVLGAIMLEPEYAYAAVADILTAEDFYLDGHGLIFNLCGELHKQGIPPDSIAVLDALRSRDKLQFVGGSGVVMGMLNSCVTAASCEHHARIVADKAKRHGFSVSTEKGAPNVNFVLQCARNFREGVSASPISNGKAPMGSIAAMWADRGKK